MIKARLNNGLIVLGLTADNIRLLKDGRPIVLSLAQLGGSDDIAIIYGDTTDAAVIELERLVGEKIPEEIKNAANKYEH